MEDPSAAHNDGQNSTEVEILSPHQAIYALADELSELDKKVNIYWWKLSGNGYNSLSRLLGVQDEEMNAILRLCKVYYGPNDSLRTSAFENLFRQIAGLDYSTYRPTVGTIEKFIQIGVKGKGELLKPKDMYVDGELMVLPVPGQHMPSVRTKKSRYGIDRLLASSREHMRSLSAAAASSVQDESPSSLNRSKEQPNLSYYLGDVLSTIRGEIERSGGRFTQTLERKLRRQLKLAVSAAGRELLETVVKRFGGEDVMKTAEPPTPDQVRSVEILETPLVPRNLSLVSPNEEDVESTQGEQDGEQGEVVDIVDPFIQDLKEEVLMQTLLYKRLHDRKERVFSLKHRNGKDMRVVLPPDSTTPDSFVEEAKRSGWIDNMLPREEQTEGILMYLHKKFPNKYRAVGKKMEGTRQVLGTEQTAALARLTGLNNTQLKKARSFLKHVGDVELKYSNNKLKEIDAEAGLETEDHVEHGSIVYEWATSGVKKKEKKAPETCPYWNSDCLKEVAAEVDLHIKCRFENDKDLKTPPLIDCLTPGFESVGAGVVCLIGGDHGDKACPMSIKLNLLSPQVRKEKKLINLQCPTIQVASVDCSKDTYGLLEQTVMPKLRKQVKDLQNCSVFVVYNNALPTKECKCFCLPRSLDIYSAKFREEADAVDGSNSKMLLICGDVMIDVASFFPSKPNATDLRVVTAITRFHDLYVGDLAFLTMLIGMNNSSGKHCLLCKYKAAEFNCDEALAEGNLRTYESLVECLNKYNEQKLAGKNVANHKGVNCRGLLDISPKQLIVPMLHCPMGLVDKILETFRSWICLEVDRLEGEAEAIRQLHKEAKRMAEQREGEQLAAIAKDKTEKSQQSKRELRDATAIKVASSKEATKAKDNYEEMIQRHNAMKKSLIQRMEEVFRSHGIKKEFYHGGKYNGVMCVKIMEKAEELFEDIGKVLLKNKNDKISGTSITTTCDKYKKLLGLLDVVWSKVRGIDGLLPTDDQINELDRAIQSAKKLWLEMKLTTLQPKWHLTFDGHLLMQMKMYGGLADKSDETIELQHQRRKKLLERYRSVPTYKKREACIRKEMKRQKSPAIQAQLDRYQSKIDKVGRKRGPTELSMAKQEAKKQKREGFLASVR